MISEEDFSDFAMGKRVAFRVVDSLLRGAKDPNVRCVQKIAVRCASGVAANPAREAKAASPSKVVKKGGAAAKDAGLEKRDKFAAILESCLEAPSPVRHLKEKDRLRELEREKLGLVSKEKERALERDKAKVKAIAKEKKKADKSGTEKEATLEVVAQTEQPYELTAEEGMKLAKEYSRFLLKEHRLKAGAENVRLQLKKDAIAALPPHLREKALVPDFTPFPPTRIAASLTPPIPGYVEEMTRSAEQSAKIQKKR